MFNTVRRMMDTNLTILPLSKVTFRVGYSHGIFQGPSTMTNRSIGKYDQLLDMYQRNGTDDFLGAIDWKPWTHTKLTFEEQVDHYKADSVYTLDPSDFIAQEADGTPVALGNYDVVPTSTAPLPYTIAACNRRQHDDLHPAAVHHSSTYTIFLGPAHRRAVCPSSIRRATVTTSYLRTQPTRVIYPTEMVRFQSTDIKNISLNGDIRYSVGNSNMPNSYENYTGLNGATRSSTITGSGIAQRRVVAFDYGMTWEATKTISLEDQVSYSNVHQPGNLTLAGFTLTEPTTAGSETINYAAPRLRREPHRCLTGNSLGIMYAYFGQTWLTNNATVSWDASTRATLALTYRYQTHDVVQTSGTGPMENLISVDDNAGILNVALRPTNHWDLNGSAEIAYNDNAFTPMTPAAVAALPHTHALPAEDLGNDFRRVQRPGTA